MSDSRPILVTGASGFLGRHVCDALLESGLPVRAMTRGKAVDHVLDVATVPDITHRASVRSAVSGVRAIVHLAAHAHVVGKGGSASDAEFERVNLLGTQTLLNEAIEASVEHMVFVSSVKALGNSSESPYREADPAKPDDAYGLSKRNAEIVLERAASFGSLAVTVVRLPLVYGPGMRANMLRLFKAVAGRRPFPFAGVKNRRSFVYVGNAVAALRELILKPPNGFEIYHVTDGEDISTAALIRAVGDALDEPVCLSSAPVWLLRSIGLLGNIAGSLAPIPDSAAMSTLTGSLQMDSSMICEELGYSPPYSLESGLAHTANWYKLEGYSCPL